MHVMKQKLTSAKDSSLIDYIIRVNSSSCLTFHADSHAYTLNTIENLLQTYFQCGFSVSMFWDKNEGEHHEETASRRNFKKGDRRNDSQVTIFFLRQRSPVESK